MNAANNATNPQTSATSASQKLINSAPNALASSLAQVQWVGAYRLEKTLGKGQTGLVKTGTHCITGKKVAVKIVNKEKLNESVLQKVEREIAIMKLIEHSNILQLYDVYENKKYLYLLLEHVSGGELFDYLVRKGRLMAKEARKFFKQIISALDFCHAHQICHRDLKPENLLLDDKNNIKIADFGMASLQLDGMLETSCGSPHYACPEVIRGEKYDGRKADVWSCGVILYALLVGALPFDDDNLRNLLEKVKKGVFHIPNFVPTDCQNLLRSMIEVDPNRRIALQEVFKHPWIIGSNKDVELELPMSMVVETHIIPNEENIDPDVFRHMSNLGCFKDKEKLVVELLSNKHNTEKIVYFLLLDRKRRRPAKEDDTDIVLRGSTFNSIADPPRKRTDQTKPRIPLTSRIADGSPLNPRKTRYNRNRQSSMSGSPESSPQISPRQFYSVKGGSANRSVDPAQPTRYDNTPSRPNFHHYTQPVNSSIVQRAARTIVNQKTALNGSPSSSHTDSSPLLNNSTSSNASTTSLISATNVSIGAPTTPTPSLSDQKSGPWRSKISNTIKNSILGTPRFHRKYSAGNNGNTSLPTGDSDLERSAVNDSTSDLTKKSFFGSLSISGADRDDVQCVVVQKKTLAEIKAELIRLFLTLNELNHQVIGQNSFKVEYKRNPPFGFSRGVKFQVDIIIPPIQPDSEFNATLDYFVVQFTLHSGPTRRFKRLIEHFSTVLQNSRNEQQSQIRQKKIEKMTSQSSVGSIDDVSNVTTIQGKHSTSSHNGPPIANDESGFFCSSNSSSNSKNALCQVFSSNMTTYGIAATEHKYSASSWGGEVFDQKVCPKKSVLSYGGSENTEDNNDMWSSTLPLCTASESRLEGTS